MKKLFFAALIVIILIGVIVAFIEFLVTKDFSYSIAVSGLVAGGVYDIVHNLDKIIQKDNLIKVIFKEDMFKNISLDKFKENYKTLEEVLEQL